MNWNATLWTRRTPRKSPLPPSKIIHCMLGEVLQSEILLLLLLLAAAAAFRSAFCRPLQM